MAHSSEWIRYPAALVAVFDFQKRQLESTVVEATKCLLKVSDGSIWEKKMSTEGWRALLVL